LFEIPAIEIFFKTVPERKEGRQGDLPLQIR
jgi:hypothetical protein